MIIAYTVCPMTINRCTRLYAFCVHLGPFFALSKLVVPGPSHGGKEGTSPKVDGSFGTGTAGASGTESLPIMADQPKKIRLLYMVNKILMVNIWLL